MKDIRQVLIVSEGSPGHLSQSRGLAEGLKQIFPKLEVSEVEGRVRGRGIVRVLLRLSMGRCGRSAWRWLRPFTGWRGPLPEGMRPDLILSSGGKSVPAARQIAIATGAPYVFVGERKPYPSEWFNLVLTPSAGERGVNDRLVDLLPTTARQEWFDRSAREWKGRPADRLWCMIIGGASRSHKYSGGDWKALAGGMNTLARREGIRWLVTTSRRTGREVESLLHAELAPSVVAEAVWWGTRPEKKMACYVGASERVFVTQDSVTMVSEAVESGRPVVMLRPSRTRFSRGSFLPGYFDRVEQGGFALGMRMDELESFSAKAAPAGRGCSSQASKLAAVVVDRL